MDLEAPTATGQGGARTSGVTSRLVAVSGQATNATRLNPRWELNDPITRQNMEKVGFRHRLFLWKPIVGSGQRGAADVNATGISPSLDCCGLPGLSAGPSSEPRSTRSRSRCRPSPQRAAWISGPRWCRGCRPHCSPRSRSVRWACPGRASCRCRTGSLTSTARWCLSGVGLGTSRRAQGEEAEHPEGRVDRHGRDPPFAEAQTRQRTVARTMPRRLP
jgi:hypothetical protein